MSSLSSSSVAVPAFAPLVSLTSADASGAFSGAGSDFLVLLRGFLGFGGAGMGSVTVLGGGGLAEPVDS